MQTHWKINGSRELILFFSGWAMDEHPTSHLHDKDVDVCTCFDYTNLKSDDCERWKEYEKITLIAWSTGVWAAEQVVGGLNLEIAISIAINGTPTTVDDFTGISRKLFEGTYSNLNELTMLKFQRRMVGSAKLFTEFEVPKRDLENQKAELAAILKVDFDACQTKFFHWHTAIVGKNDAIFPTENQLRYWNEKTDIVEVEMPHFPFLEFRSWISICDVV